LNSLVWTSELPDSCGFYFRDEGGQTDEIEVVSIYRESDGSLWCSGEHDNSGIEHYARRAHRWSGPIPLPKEPDA